MRDDSHPLCLVHVSIVARTLDALAGQAGFFRAHGFEVEAIASPGDELIELGRREGIAVHAVPMGRTITPLRDPISLYKLWRLLRRLRPAIVNAHTPKGGLLGMTAAWLAGVPVRIYHVHGLPLMTAGGIRRLLLRWSDRVAGRLAHRVLCVSHSLRRAALAEGLFPVEKVRVLARGTINGVDSAVRFNPAVVRREEAGREVRAMLGIPAEACVLGFVGRGVRDKGIVELAIAWRDLREQYPDMHLLIVGPFESHDPVPAEIRGELADDLRAHLVDRWVDDIPPFYSALDVLALPSYREGFSCTLLEAAAMGLPVVATRVPGCVDAVEDGVTGRLVPPYDSRALTEAVAAYMGDPHSRRENGRAAHERVVRDFGQQEVWDALSAEYRGLLTARLGVTHDLVVQSAKR